MAAALSYSLRRGWPKATSVPVLFSSDAGLTWLYGLRTRLARTDPLSLGGCNSDMAEARVQPVGAGLSLPF
jgi:hypothetical protein